MVRGVLCFRYCSRKFRQNITPCIPEIKTAQRGLFCLGLSPSFLMAIQYWKYAVTVKEKSAENKLNTINFKLCVTGSRQRCLVLPCFLYLLFFSSALNASTTSSRTVLQPFLLTYHFLLKLHICKAVFRSFREH